MGKNKYIIELEDSRTIGKRYYPKTDRNLKRVIDALNKELINELKGLFPENVLKATIFPERFNLDDLNQKRDEFIQKYGFVGYDLIEAKNGLGHKFRFLKKENFIEDITSLNIYHPRLDDILFNHFEPEKLWNLIKDYVASGVSSVDFFLNESTCLQFKFEKKVEDSDGDVERKYNYKFNQDGSIDEFRLFYSVTSYDYKIDEKFALELNGGIPSFNCGERLKEYGTIINKQLTGMRSTDYFNHLVKLFSLNPEKTESGLILENFTIKNLDLNLPEE